MRLNDEQRYVLGMLVIYLIVMLALGYLLFVQPGQEIEWVG